ncbi:LamG domain-containing protein [Pontiellaceae bacterium B12219]|nr:LamG domain-containing protein [Pontiellaceae bacterium B12219]
MKTQIKMMGAVFAGIVGVGVSQAALVGEWTFDSQSFVNSGTSGSIHDGTFVTANTDYFSSDTFDGGGYSLRIQSVADNDYTTGGDVLLINNSKSTDAGYLPTFDGSVFTLSMWMKTEDASWTRWDEIGGKGNENADSGWAVRSSNDDRIWFSSYGDGGLARSLSSTEVLDQNWHLITVTYDATGTGSMKMYIDGQFEHEDTSAAISDASLYALVFGAREDGSRGENILLDNIQYYDTELSAEEIAALYTTPIAFYADPAEIELELVAPATTITGSVAVSYMSETDVEVSISISDPAHPGAFSVLSATPQILTEPSPASTVIEFEFDNSIANLADGESATGVVTFAWNESGASTTNEVSVPMSVLFYEANWMAFEELGKSPSAVNPLELSVDGSMDWVMLGRDGSTVNRDEKSGADYIGDVTVAGTHGAWAANAYLSSWTNGSPVLSTNDVKGSWEASESLSFSVDGLDAGGYSLILYCSKYNAIGEMTATLGEESIVRYFDVSGTGGGAYYGVFSINIGIASMGESLDVSYALSAGSGNVGITAITLSRTFTPDPTVGAISIELISGGTEAALSWDTIGGANSLYGLQAAPNLSTGPWESIISNVQGTGGKVTVTNPVSENVEFYRAYIQD